MAAGRSITRKHINRFVLGVTLAAFGLGLSAVSADVVTRGAARDPSAGSGLPVGSFAGSLLSRRHSRTSFDFSLDLSGYLDAAVSFDFASLIARDRAGFSVSSATGESFVDGFRLLSPIGSPSAAGSPGRFVRTGGARGFQRRAEGATFATAMFNLAAYDGQTVLFRVTYDGRAASRRGSVNVENLLIEVRPSGATTATSAATVPEPTSLALFLVALLALFAWKAGKGVRL